MQKPQLSVPTPHFQFTRTTHRALSDDIKDDTDKDNKLPERIEHIYENKSNIIRIQGNVVNVENKLSFLDVNCTYEFSDKFSYEGGGCLKLITNIRNSYHR